MPRPYKPVVPQDIGELLDMLEWMSYAAPTFKEPLSTRCSLAATLGSSSSN